MAVMSKRRAFGPSSRNASSKRGSKPLEVRGAKTSFAEGIQRTIEWFDADARRKEIDDAANAAWDKLIDAYEIGLTEAVRRFR